MTEPLTRYQLEVSEELLQLIEAAQQSMVKPDGMTDSDIQGAVEAFTRKYVPEVDPRS